MRILWQKPKRIENVKFIIKGAQGKNGDIKDIFKSFDVDPNIIKDGDTLIVDFTLDFEYYGKALEYLQSVEMALDRGLLVSVDLKELISGKSVLVDVIKKIENLEKKLKNESME